jgi:hypothetical protein
VVVYTATAAIAALLRGADRLQRRVFGTTTDVVRFAFASLSSTLGEINGWRIRFRESRSISRRRSRVALRNSGAASDRILTNLCLTMVLALAI